MKEKSWQYVLKTIRSTLESLPESFELILVDDGSPDDTWEIIMTETEKTPCCQAIRLSRNFGKESAVRAGLETARGNVVIVMDGDLQHPPELIPDMVSIWRQGKADVVEAIKERRGPESLFNKSGAKLFYFLLNTLSGYDIDNYSDYKLS